MGGASELTPQGHLRRRPCLLRAGVNAICERYRSIDDSIDRSGPAELVGASRQLDGGGMEQPAGVGEALLYASMKPSALVQLITCLICLAMNSSISSMVTAPTSAESSSPMYRGSSWLIWAGVLSAMRVGLPRTGASPLARRGRRGAHGPLAALGRLFVGDLRLLGELFAGVFGKAGRRVELAVGADAAGQIGDLVGLDQLPADLGDQLAADGQLFGHAAVRPVVMQLELHLDGTPALAAGQRQAVKEIDAGDEIEGVGEGALADLGADRSLAEHDGCGVAMEAVGDEQPLVDVVDRDRRQPLPRVGVAFDREIVEAITQVQVLVENQVIEGNLANLHRGKSFVVGMKAQLVRARERGCRGVSNPTLSA